MHKYLAKNQKTSAKILLLYAAVLFLFFIEYKDLKWIPTHNLNFDVLIKKLCHFVFLNPEILYLDLCEAIDGKKKILFKSPVSVYLCCIYPGKLQLC